MKEFTHYMPPEAIGKTEESLAHEANSRRGKWPHFTPTYIGNQIPNFDLQKTLEEIGIATENYQENRITQAEAQVKIDSPLPIGIVFLGDLHIGSAYTNHDEIMRKLDIIKSKPNTYVIFMSNLIDNAIPAQFPDGMLQNVIKPDRQVVMMRHLLQDLNTQNKVLAVVTSPCHEGWTWKKTGQDINKLLYDFPDRHFPVLENGGRLLVELPNTKYLGALYHQVGPFESNFNETHALRQLNRLQLGMEADFVAGAHRHFAAAETVYEGKGLLHRKMVAYIRTGSEKGTGKIHDDWAVGRSGETGEPSGQVLHLFPNQKRLACEIDFDTGVLAHEAYYVSALMKYEKDAHQPNLL